MSHDNSDTEQRESAEQSRSGIEHELTARWESVTADGNRVDLPQRNGRAPAGGDGWVVSAAGYGQSGRPPAYMRDKLCNKVCFSKLSVRKFLQKVTASSRRELDCITHHPHLAAESLQQTIAFAIHEVSDT